MRRYENGFTLVELLLVAVVLAALGVAAYTALSGGIRLWKAVNRETPQKDMRLFFLKMSDDLRSAFKYSSMGFSGEPESVSFPTFVTSFAGEDAEERMGWVSYHFDAGGSSVVRTESDYSQFYVSKPGSVRPLVDGVASVRFQYYCYDPETESYIWMNAWSEEEAPSPGVEVDKTLPRAVKVEVELGDGYRGEIFSEVLPVPAGG